MAEPGRIRFAPACETDQAQLDRTTEMRGRMIRVDRLRADTVRTLTTSVEFPSEGGVVLFGLVGTVLFRLSHESDWRIAAPKSATFLEGPTVASIRVARGSHELLAIYWSKGAFPVLDLWLAGRTRKGEVRLPQAGTHPIYPLYQEMFGRFQNALQEDGDLAEQRLAGIILESAASLTLSDNEHFLAATPPVLPDLTTRLIAAVRLDPSQPWPLKEAADFVGYSPFHFSRIFKVQVGMGFHEFVDRTRTELAVRRLTTSDAPIDMIASQTGFGTTQGLRESVKEYLNLVPSELRSNVEDA